MVLVNIFFLANHKQELPMAVYIGCIYIIPTK